MRTPHSNTNISICPPNLRLRLRLVRHLLIIVLSFGVELATQAFASQISRPPACISCCAANIVVVLCGITPHSTTTISPPAHSCCGVWCCLLQTVYQSEHLTVVSSCGSPQAHHSLIPQFGFVLIYCSSSTKSAPPALMKNLREEILHHAPGALPPAKPQGRGFLALIG